MADLFLSGVVGSEIQSQDVIDFLTNTSDENITVFLNSPGGNVQEGIAIYNLLRASGRNIKTVLTSVAASMGSIIFLAGDERVAMTGARYMVHKPSAGVLGNADELREGAMQLDTAQDSLVSIYKERTGIDNINDLVNSTKWFNTDEMNEMGITTSQQTIKMQNIFKGEDMSKIDDLRAELEKVNAENAELKEKQEEAELEAQIAKAKAETEAMKAKAEAKPDTEPEKSEPENDAAAANDEKDDVVEDVVSEETSKAIDMTNAVKVNEETNTLPAFMQSQSSY